MKNNHTELCKRLQIKFINLETVVKNIYHHL